MKLYGGVEVDSGRRYIEDELVCSRYLNLFSWSSLDIPLGVHISVYRTCGLVE